MCIILPVSHISCSHTVSIWQHCSDATSSETNTLRPCRDVRFHERPILTGKSCGDCNAPRLFVRRGGIAERGDGSSLRSPEAYANAKEEDANDSGYHSDVIHEEEEHSDLDECPLSPKAIAPPRARPQTCGGRKRGHRSLTRTPSSRSNLKHELSKIRLEDTSSSVPRRDSIDSLLSKFDDRSWMSTRVEVGAKESTTGSNIQKSLESAMHQTKARKRRASALLHPSSPPPVETTGEAQIAKAFPFPQVVDVRRSPSRQSSTRSRKKSTLLHPSSPELDSRSGRPSPEIIQSSRSETTAPLKRRPAMLTRRESSLLHPSSPPRAATTLSPSQIPTIISIPPAVKRPSTLLQPSRAQTMRQPPIVPSRRMPPLQTTLSEPPQSATMARQRQESILHSSLSDQEDGSDDEGYSEEGPAGFEDIGARLQAFSFNKRDPRDSGLMTNPPQAQTQIEYSLLTSSAQAAQASRHTTQGERK